MDLENIIVLYTCSHTHEVTYVIRTLVACIEDDNKLNNIIFILFSPLSFSLTKSMLNNWFNLT